MVKHRNSLFKAVHIVDDIVSKSLPWVCLEREGKSKKGGEGS